tara:strand:- start:4253 stop:5803 length:1551 start_codon:yes stop_codon:yes gene_type:complete
MKLKSLAHIIPLSLPLAFSAAVQAVENLELTDLTHNDPFFYTSDQYIKADNKQKELLGVGRPNTTHSKIPHLPVYYGYMNTNSTYRFVNVVEQVFTMVGEGKHGLWRVQENGTVREYLRVGAKGLAPNADLTAPENQKIIKENYSSYLPNESWSGYKYPDQKMNEAGNLNFIDLPITHAKYQGKYAKHQPIDLPNWYCTMSGNDYAYAKQAMNFAFSQKGANQVGPLGQRAGLDVNENYTSVLRLKTMGDGRSWVNVAEKNGDKINVKWEAVDESKTNAEYYLVERPFFNKPYLFVTAVYDNKDNNDHSYVRPKGPYFDSIKDKGAKLKTKVTAQPRFHLESGKLAKAVGLPIYGVHHPDRAVYGSGGACPLKGGDWGRYPDTSGGSGWPTNYEEVTPLCDSVLLDIKFYANLDGRDWNDPNKYLANAGAGTKEVTYNMQPGTYGEFTDPYNTERGVKNEQSQYVPSEVTLSYDKIGEPVSYIDAPNLDLSAIMVPSEATTCRPVIHASLDKEFTK